jgi:hypothetical protein
MKNYWNVVAIFVLVLICGDVYAAERFGRMYDITGNVTLLRNGKREVLSRGKNLLAPVFEGDELSVSAGGRLLVVSGKDNKGYELLPGATARIIDSRLQKVAGTIKSFEGLHAAPSDKELKGNPGVLVMRGSRQCIKIVSPQDENLIDTSVELLWSIKCKEVENVRIEVREDKPNSLHEKPIFVAKTSAGLVRLPSGSLKHGTDYQWTIDAGPGLGKSTAFFRVLDEAYSSELASKIGVFKGYDNDVSKQLSYIFFLKENGLHSLADKEIVKLKDKQEWNQFLIEVLE